MFPTEEGALSPELIGIASEAFNRSWQFIQQDPVLAGHDHQALRAELARRIIRETSDGERDALLVANRAIGGIRETGRSMQTVLQVSGGCAVRLGQRFLMEFPPAGARWP